MGMPFELLEPGAVGGCQRWSVAWRSIGGALGAGQQEGRRRDPVEQAGPVGPAVLGPALPWHRRRAGEQGRPAGLDRREAASSSGHPTIPTSTCSAAASMSPAPTSPSTSSIEPGG